MRQRVVLIVVLGLLGSTLTGCATAVIGGITVGQITTAAGIASVGTTGKGLQYHALSAMTGKDCRLLEGIVRQNRHICEVPGSPATENDFRGVVAMLRGEEERREPEVLYAGTASDFAPVLTRTERQTRRTSLEPGAPVQLAAPDATFLRPAASTPASLPTMAEWANLQPAPSLALGRWSEPN